MKQSNIIFATLVFAFVIYITLRDQLPDYISVFTGADVKKSAPADQGESANTGLQEQWDNALKNGYTMLSNTGLV